MIGTSEQSTDDETSLESLVCLSFRNKRCADASATDAAHADTGAHCPVQRDGRLAEEDTAAIKSKRPTVSRPAEFQAAGLLQIEYGYDGNFRSRDVRRDEAGSLTISFAATNRLQLELDLDTVASQVDRASARVTGLGDARLGFQFTTLRDNARHPSLAFAYVVKLPSASATSGLGTR